MFLPVQLDTTLNGMAISLLCSLLFLVAAKIYNFPALAVFLLEL